MVREWLRCQSCYNDGVSSWIWEDKAWKNQQCKNCGQKWKQGKHSRPDTDQDLDGDGDDDDGVGVSSSHVCNRWYESRPAVKRRRLRSAPQHQRVQDEP